uniref:palmitoyl-protein hydrolase n=1 Tax=Photinus pyralis TaxID=7054 RepID=A0A1Y1L1Q1_PHOPY
MKLPGAADDGTKLSGGLAAFIGFSCRMPFPGRTLKETRAVLGLEDAPEDDEVIRKTPVLLEHCVDDPLVLVENGRVLRDTLRGFGAEVHWREYPDGGHWFNSPAGMDDAAEYLTHILGLTPASAAANGTEMDLS